MRLQRWFNRPVSIRAYASTPDDLGTPVETHDPVGVAARGRLEQVESQEVTRGRDVVTADWKLFLPAGTTIGPYDLVEADGKVFEVAGLPNHLSAPGGRLDHIEVLLRYREG